MGHICPAGHKRVNKISGRMVRGNGFCPEIIHVSYSNRNDDKHNPAVLMTVAARSKARDCGRSLAGIASSNSTGDMDVCRECCVLCRWRSL